MKEKENFTAMILAAGYGTRLRPLTTEIPKPLIPVGDRTLLENIMVNLKNAGVAKFAVNAHHLADKMKSSVIASSWDDKVNLLYEPEILGTGGPLVNAKDTLLSGDGFLLHNGDILTDIDLSQLVKVHLSDSSNLVTMVMLDGPENCVSVNSEHRIVDILGKLNSSEECRMLTYAGIACFSPAIFDYLPDRPENYSIITAILNLMRNTPNSVAAYIPEGDFIWNDLGTVEKFIAAHKEITEGRLILPTLNIENKIPMPMQLLQQQGSGRLFFRIQKTETTPSKVIMCASDDNKDFDRFCEIGKFLYSKQLGTPELIAINPENHTVVMEDLGNDTLFNRVNSCKNSSEVEELYRKVIRWLVKFQVETYNKITPESHKRPETEELPLRIFDYDYLRWETDYFKENFLIKYSHIESDKLSGLDTEFDTIARDALTAPQVMIHRDFQSQNILIQNEEVRIVDFQGARIGHIAYDLMSLINDPYICLDKELRDSLFEYFFNIAAETPLLHPLLKTKALRSIMAIAHSAALQRGMQALGAYAYLSLEKGKKEYAEFIGPALKLLNETLQRREEYPLLKALIKDLTAE